MTTHPVTQDIATYFPATFELATAAIILAIVIGIPFGVIAAARQGSRLITWCAWSAWRESVPVFVLALIFLLIFYVKLGIAPGTGQIDVLYDGDGHDRITGMLVINSAIEGQWDVFWNALAHLAMPAIILGYFSLAYITRMTRAFMLDALAGEYIVTARAKGLSAPASCGGTRSATSRCRW